MKRKKLLPGRSMLAVRGSDRGTATWAIKHGVWFCESASKHLRWMRRMENFETARNQLRERGFKWEWIVPNVGGKIRPPFSP